MLINLWFQRSPLYGKTSSFTAAAMAAMAAMARSARLLVARSAASGACVASEASWRRNQSLGRGTSPGNPNGTCKGNVIYD